MISVLHVYLPVLGTFLDCFVKRLYNLDVSTNTVKILSDFLMVRKTNISKNKKILIRDL